MKSWLLPFYYRDITIIDLENAFDCVIIIFAFKVWFSNSFQNLSCADLKSEMLVLREMTRIKMTITEIVVMSVETKDINNCTRYYTQATWGRKTMTTNIDKDSNLIL